MIERAALCRLALPIAMESLTSFFFVQRQPTLTRQMFDDRPRRDELVQTEEEEFYEVDFPLTNPETHNIGT